MEGAPVSGTAAVWSIVLVVASCALSYSRLAKAALSKFVVSIVVPRVFRGVSDLERYYSFLDCSANLVMLLDRSGKCVTVNKAGLELIGRSLDEVIGASISDILISGATNDVIKSTQLALQGKRTFFEATTRISDDNAIYWQVSISAVSDKKKIITHLVLVAVDITEHKRDTEKLKLNESRLESLLKLNQMQDRTEREIASFALRECVRLTDSGMGYVSLVNETETEVEILSWCGIDPSLCSLPNNHIFHIETSGVWADSIRSRKAVINNNYSDENPGIPAGHVEITRFVTVPVFDDDKIVALAAVANKPTDYTEADVVQISLFVQSMRRILQHGRSEAAIKESEARYRLLADNVTDVIWTTDLGLNLTYVSPSAVKLTGFPAELIIGRSVADMLTPESYDHARAVLLEELASEGIVIANDTHSRKLDLEIRHRDGSTVWTESDITFLRDDNGKPVGVLGVARDITARREAETIMQMHTSAINAASDQIIITDTDGKIVFINPAFEKETGYTAEEVIGRPPDFLNSDKHTEEFYSDLWEALAAGRMWRGEMMCKRKDGGEYSEDATITPIRDESGAVKHFVAIKRNITERKVFQARLDRLAHHDPMTGLPNRLLFSDRLTQSLAHSRRANKLTGVMLLDLDRFKLINDALGHKAGDLLLKAVSERLVSCLREGDTLARMGGDEFAIILADLDSRDQTGVVSERVLKSFVSPFIIQGYELFVVPSIGISIFPENGQSVESLVKNADIAMYKAKEAGGGVCRLYHEPEHSLSLERITLENDLRKAVERKELVVYYQPQVDILTGDITGAEALVRWNHPRLGILLPSSFIPIAEETGLIASISHFVLSNACSQNKKWQVAGYNPITIAVNISARQFQEEVLKGVVRRVLTETGMDPGYLDLELTESTLMQDPSLANIVLTELKAMGVQVSIDDFGTGYSSLSYLKRFPVHTVKIDQSFVKDIVSNPDDAAISRAVVAMAHSLKLKVIAEGVETTEQLNYLREIECDAVQGYFISHPVPADEFEELLRASVNALPLAA